MIDAVRSTLAIATLAAACIVLPIVAPARAASNPTIEALQQTPVSLFTYGLDALRENVNATIGNGKTPLPFAMFAGPLSGKIADMATVIYNADAGTITINLVHIDSLDISDPAVADNVCSQGIGLLRLIAELDPASGQLQTGMKNSELSEFFSATGTPVKSPANDFTTLDQAFRFRYVFDTGVGHFECTAPLFGTAHTLKKLAY